MTGKYCTNSNTVASRGVFSFQDHPCKEIEENEHTNKR